jgi:hypothetical protein
MRQARSLEEERQQLLQQLESSRAVYRRMLTDTGDEADEAMPPYVYDGETVTVRRSGFPQSHTMRWIMRHPYLTGLGAFALIMAGKKGWAKTRKKAEPAPPRTAEDNDAGNKKSIAATTLGTTLATTAAMMLRNPAQVQAAMRAVGVAMNYYKSRRRHARQGFE